MSKKVTTDTAKLFIGLDIHKKCWMFHFTTDLFSGSGKSFPAGVDHIKKYVDKHYSEYDVAITYESACFGYEPARAFISYGWDRFIVNPGDIPRPSKNKFAKSDKIDAKNLSEQLRSGHLKKIQIPDRIREGLRSLTRQRTALVRDFRRIKTRIKSLLLYYHISIPEGMDTPKWPIRFLDWLEDLELNNFNQKDTIQSMLRQYRFLDLELKDLSNRIRKYCKKNLTKDYQLLRSVPGIAGLSAGYILSELGDLRRFSSLKKLASL